MSPTLRALNRRLDAAAYGLLCEEIARLDEENSRLRTENADLLGRLSWAEDCVERWRDDALDAINAAGAVPGLTQSGHLVACMPDGAPA